MPRPAVSLRAAALAVALACAAGAMAQGSPLPGHWTAAAVDADVERAFARAAAEHKPVLLYWGASWCPPCNRLKATLFNRHDFIEQSRALVAVHVDGDRPGAQKLGARFKVRGYPTLVLLAADGREIARLPGEAEPEQVVALLRQGLAGGRAARDVLADARAGKPLSPSEWQLVAFDPWQADGEALVPDAERAALAARLAAAAPQPRLAQRLWLRAVAASDDGKGLRADDALRARVDALLADPTAARAQADLLVQHPREIVRALADEGSTERDALVQRYDAALRRLVADATLSRADRVLALLARVELARLALPPEHDGGTVRLPAALREEVRRHVERDDREIVDGYERQAVITTAAYLLGRAGLAADADALLVANLQRSHSPYYLMSQLAGNAKRRGDKAEALRWSEQAWAASVGPATRLQWGASHLAQLVELAPDDAPRIEAAASRLFGEAAQDASAFYGRSLRSLQRVGGQLLAWNLDGRHGAAVARLRAQLAPVCAKLPDADGQRDACRGLLRPGARQVGGEG